jgi:hypothetical protein
MKNNKDVIKNHIFALANQGAYANSTGKLETFNFNNYNVVIENVNMYGKNFFMKQMTRFLSPAEERRTMGNMETVCLQETPNCHMLGDLYRVEGRAFPDIV